MERVSWTDERLDDFAERVSADLRDLRTEMREMRAELRNEFHTEIGELRNEFHTEIGGLRSELHSEIGALRSLVLRVGGGMLIAQFGMIAALIARG